MTELLLPEDDISTAYLEGRDQVNRYESPAVLALQKYSTPEEFQAMAPQLGFQPPMAGRPVPAGGSSVVGGEGLHVGTPDDIRAGKIPDGERTPSSRDAMRPGVVMGYDISRYATDPTHEQKVGAFASQMVHLDNATAIEQHIRSIAPGSPITGQMVMEASRQSEVSPAMILALMRQDSTYGTKGLAVKTQNPGNVGNDDAGNTKTYPTWDAGVGAVAQWLASNRAGGKQPLTQMPPPLEMLAMGMKREDIEAEMQGLQVASAFADPINLGVDIGTGFLSSAGREAFGIIASGAVKAGGRMLGKEVGEQVTYGALGSAFLNAAEGAGLGPIMQDISGIIGPVATGALLQLPRSGLTQYLRQLEVGNPEVFDKLKAKFYEFKESPAWQVIANDRGSIGVDDLNAKFKKISPEEFVAQRDKSSKRPFLTPYQPEEMIDWQLHLTDDGVGFALTPELDMVGVFNNSGKKGAGKEAVSLAIYKGAKTCDCVDGFLSSYYNSFGFVEKKRVPWDDSKAPKDWNYEENGRREIVFFEFPEGQSRDPADTATRLRIARSEGGPWRTGLLWNHDRWVNELAKEQGRGVDNPTPSRSSEGASSGGRSVNDSIKALALAILKSEEGSIKIGPTAGRRTTEPSGPKPLEQDATALKRMPEAERQIEKAVLRDDLPLPKSKYISTNINQTKLETSDDIIKLIDQVGKSIEPEINAARREKISLEQTQRMANDLGWSVETLLKRNRGQAFNAEQVTASRMIMMDSADSVIDLAKRVRAGDNSDETMVALRGAISRHAAIQAQVSGMAAEAGRALNAFNIMAKAGQLQGLKQALEQGGGRDNIEAMADAIVSVAEAQTMAGVKPTLSGINAVTKKLERATTWDMIMEAWIMGLLSGPQTHAANVLSNALTATWMVPERKLASWISQSPIGSGEIMSGEATALAYGLVNGFQDGLVMASKALRTGKGSETLGAKIEGHRAAITAENIRQLPLSQKLPTNILEPGGWMARAVDLLGETVRTPGRFLTSEDELFRAIGYRMEVQAQAFRQASSEGLEDTAFANRITELVNNPPDNIKLAGISAANYQTFTGKTGPLANAIKVGVSNVPVLRVIIPFINTPANIAKFSLERTPLAPMFKAVRADLAAGGARRDMALARISLGSMVMASVAAWSAAGVITGGGPADKDMKEILKRKGWKPYSIKIGKNYVSYNRLDPIGMVMGMAADSAEIMGQVGELDASQLAGATIIAISQNLLSKTYTRGLADAFDVISSAQKYENANRGRDYLVKMAQSIVPAGLAQINRTLVDDQLRNVRQYQGWEFFKNSLLTRVPGYSDDLPPQRNLWGEPIVLEGGVGPDIMSPIYTNSEKVSPIDDELLRLKLPIQMPRPSIGGVELSAREYDRFLQLSGNELKNPANGLGMKDALSKLITEPHYQKQSDNTDDLKGGKALLIESTVRAYRELAKAKLLQEFPDLADLIKERAGMEAKALKPAY